MKRESKLLVLLAVAALFWGCGPTEETAADQQPETEAIHYEQLENGEGIIDVDDHQIHYEVTGSGPACIVLTNAWGLNYQPLKTMFAGLEDVLTLIYFDPRGMGESSPIAEEADMSMAAVREDAMIVINHLELDEVYVLGWSNGASNTYLFAGEYPQVVKGAIALHSTEKMTQEDMQHMQENAAEMQEAYLNYMNQIQSDALTEQEKELLHHDLYMDWFPTMLADRETDREGVEAMFADAQFSYKHAMYSYMQELPYYDATEMLKQVDSPMLIIAGAHDEVPPESVKRAADLVENSTFVVFEESGHFAPIEEPEKFKQVVVEFINSVE